MLPSTIITINTGAGNQFLIDFDCEELFDQCINWEWVWLPEIFSDIIRWFKEASNLNKGVLEDEVDESSRSSFNSSCDVSRSVKTTYIQEKVFVSAKIMSVVEVDGSEDSCSWLSDIGFGYDCMKVSGVKDIPEAY
ncbi:hypothetical protein V6N13_096114 [Hibiscus sabdariffa]